MLLRNYHISIYLEFRYSKSNEADHEKETQDLQKAWMKLRQVVRYVYRAAGTGLAQTQESNNNAIPDVSKMKELVHR